jgi:8-oxo-dGTP diphosphatase
MIMSASMPSTVPDSVKEGEKSGLPDYSGYLHVAVAVIEDPAGRILLARRPQHLHQGGLWEFPGGKVESGEDVRSALVRELEEEVGITLTCASPLIRIPYAYPDRKVLLDVWRVSAFENVAHGAEGQVIRWVEPNALHDYDFPEANRPIITAAMLPSRYLITPDPGGPDDWPAFLSHLHTLIDHGIRLVQLRAKSLTDNEYRLLARKVIAIGRARGATIMLNASLEYVREFDADGLHLSSSQLRHLEERPLDHRRWLSASCHNLAELQHAMAVGVDFAVLSPVNALGGMSEADIEIAKAYGGQGIAAITGLW